MKKSLAAPRAWIEAHPLGAPLLAGALARLVAATVGIGFHARDDYFHVLAPALRWAEDPSFDWDASGLPGAGLRSHLVPRAVQGVVEAARGLGVHEPDDLLRVLYLVVGAYSLLVVPFMYLAGKRLLDERGARLSAWLAALHFAMPYAGTRLLIEGMAMPPLALGLWLVTYASAWRVLLGGFAVGLACWLRYQLGVAAIGLALVLFVSRWRNGGWREATRVTLALALGGGAAIALQGLFDLVTTGRFLGPLLANIAYNAAPPAELTRSSWVSYLGVWLALTAPPATLVVLPAMVRAGKQLPLVGVPFVLFVLAHSFVPHKEERFMLPVLPLFLLLLAASPAALASGASRLWDALRAAWPVLRPWFLGAHALALALAIASQSQANVREALAHLRHDRGARGLVVLGPELPEFFLGERALPARRSGKVDAVFLARAIDELAREGAVPNRFMGFAAEAPTLSLLLAAMGFDCGEPFEARGWWFDRLVYRVNPKHNRRRSPILVWSCEPPAVAQASAKAGPGPGTAGREP